MYNINLRKSCSDIFTLLLTAVDVFDKDDAGYDELIDWAKKTVDVLDMFFKNDEGINNKITDEYKYIKMFLKSKIYETDIPEKKGDER
jgi:hypothetical protein